MKTAELTGALLDYWVARAEGWGVTAPPIVEFYDEKKGWRAYAPSTDWAQGGPLIEKYRCDLSEIARLEWRATTELENCYGQGEGNTPLQAICRAVVRAKFGDEVPDQGTES